MGGRRTEAFFIFLDGHPGPSNTRNDKKERFVVRRAQLPNRGISNLIWTRVDGYKSYSAPLFSAEEAIERTALEDNFIAMMALNSPPSKSAIEDA
jgi:hypothetical protein